MQLSFTIDGSQVEMDIPVRATLAEVVQNLRGNQILPTPCCSATCGACTVLLNDAPVLSCMTPAALCERAELTTAAGLTHDPRLASLRNLFADPLMQACGICASGILSSSAALLDANPRPTREDVRHALTGHACLCIGYGTILDAVTAHGTSISLAPSASHLPERLPSREDIANTLAQERSVVDERGDPLGPISAMLRLQATTEPLKDAARAFGWSWQSATEEETRQRSGSWVALEGTADNAAVVFVALEVDTETEIVSLHRAMALLVGTAGSVHAVAESGVMRGIFLALRPGADADRQFFPANYPTSIDLPEISVNVASADGVTPPKPSCDMRRDVCLATVRAISGAIHRATGAFPDSAPYAPRWSMMPDLDNASNIS